MTIARLLQLHILPSDKVYIHEQNQNQNQNENENENQSYSISNIMADRPNPQSLNHSI
jgi:hypothetical protein